MATKIKFLSITHTTSDVNEDYVGKTENRGWILDGATSISGRRKSYKERVETDAAWFVRIFSALLKQKTPTNNILNDLRETLKYIEKIAISEWNNWDDQDIPSASFSHVTINSSSVILHNLGDCRVLYQVDNGPIQSFGSCNVATLDSALVEDYLSIRQDPTSITHNEAWKTLIPKIRENRKLMNQPEGYWILSPDGNGLPHIECLEVNYDSEIKILLATDGLYRLVDTYLTLSQTSFFEEAHKDSGLERLLKLLRETEDNDADSLKYPRIKLQDDASALSIQVSCQYE